ncbi:MAG: polysaccharide pyruvyl transferase family protein [Nocardioidaceae bacterium]
MSSVGIATLGGYTNYGNRLQNLALQEAITTLGHSPVLTIEGLPTHETRAVKTRRLLSTGLSRRNELLARLKGSYIRVPDTHQVSDARRSTLREFSSAHINATPYEGSNSWFQESSPGGFDHVVLGSDQVWNPAFTHANSAWFLDFVPPEQRIAYAASIGVPKIPPYLIRRYRRGLSSFKAISVREEQAATIVEEIIGKRPQVVLDPTMLIGRDWWEQHMVRPTDLAPGSYVAKFLLSTGDSTHTASVSLCDVHDFSTQSDLTVVDLDTYTPPDKHALDPLEFIGVLKHSALVVTDSFHAAVFAILFHRPFLLVSRGSMNSRFDTLLDHVALDGRHLMPKMDIHTALEVDWDSVDTKLAERRSLSWDFLVRSLGSE